MRFEAKASHIAGTGFPKALTALDRNRVTDNSDTFQSWDFLVRTNPKKEPHQPQGLMGFSEDFN
ncbi:hypothetical protein [Novipirellula rosea]|uniref:Uncharacterized protein n=1 Tax=Novipirellula rosea TaxID=1031540 RepID=A0ABP8N4F1_9BACT